jgi:hypothetical protein
MSHCFRLERQSHGFIGIILLEKHSGQFGVWRELLCVLMSSYHVRRARQLGSNESLKYLHVLGTDKFVLIDHYSF